jgi:thioredoxin reductase
MSSDRYDAIVIGGGPAGLTGALWLARYRHRVRLFDAGDPRNAPTTGVHGFLGLQDIPPLELRRIGRAQATDAGAETEEAVVETIDGEIDDFVLRLADGRGFGARRILFATGLRDIIPEIPGLMDCYGTSIWHCPDCDGPSIVGRKVAVIGWGRSIAAYCMQMLTWTDRLTILTHGHPADMPSRSAAALDRFGIPVRTQVIREIDGQGGQVEGVTFMDGSREEFDSIFFHIATGPGCSIPAALGCQADEEGILEVDSDFHTTVPGVFAAGDITPGSKSALRAASEGARAAIGIYRSLLPEERKV